MTTPTPTPAPRTYTSGEVARALGVSRQTVRRYADPGRTPGGHRRYTQAEVDAIRDKMAAAR